MILFLSALAAAAPLPVHLSVHVPGAALAGDWSIADAAIHTRPADVLAADAVALAAVAAGLKTVDGLDDYGRVVLAAAAIDALPVAIRPSGPIRNVREAIAAGEWTSRDRRLAIGAVLRDQGYDVLAVTSVLGQPLIALRTTDTALNADTITVDWTGSPSELWLMWDGDGRIGYLDRGVADLDVPEDAPAHGRAFSFVPMALPAFIAAHTEPVALAIDGTSDRLEFTVPVEAAAWLRYYPTLEFPAAVAQARAAIGTIHGLDHLATPGLSEPAVLDRLLRTVQADLTYRAPTPLEPLATTLTTRVADCDGYALLLAVILLDMGYPSADLRGVSWPDHQALAVHPRATGPVNGTSLDVDGRDYFVLDPTFFVTQDGALITRWGDVPWSRGSRAVVEDLGG